MPPSASPELAWLVEGKVVPLVPDSELGTIAALAGSEQTLTEDQVKAILETLSQSPRREEGQGKKKYVYVSGGKLFRLDRDGRLEAVNDDAAEPVTWPLGHEVRPARQSLGVNGCKDCHRFGSPFLFRKAKGTGPLKTDHVKTISANAFMHLDRPYQTALRPFLRGPAALQMGSLSLHPRPRLHPGSRRPSRPRPTLRADREKELAAMLFRIISAISILALAGRPDLSPVQT